MFEARCIVAFCHFSDGCYIIVFVIIILLALESCHQADETLLCLLCLTKTDAHLCVESSCTVFDVCVSAT